MGRMPPSKIHRRQQPGGALQVYTVPQERRSSERRSSNGRKIWQMGVSHAGETTCFEWSLSTDLVLSRLLSIPVEVANRYLGPTWSKHQLRVSRCHVVVTAVIKSKSPRRLESGRLINRSTEGRPEKGLTLTSSLVSGCKFSPNVIIRNTDTVAKESTSADKRELQVHQRCRHGPEMTAGNPS